MKTWKRVAFTTSAIVVVGAVALTGRALIMGGVFTEVKPVPLECRTLAGVTGAEDIAIDRKSGLVFLSATDRRPPYPDKPMFKDGTYALALDHPKAGFVRLAGTPKDFHPHGISLFRAADGSLTLMAVNHISPKRHAIDVFEVKIAGDKISLSEVGDIQSDKLNSPNDVAAVGKEQFYVTNDHGSRTDLGKTLENYLMLPRADVLYFDGAVFKDVAANLVFANGIALSNDGNRLYVAETTAHRVQTFGRDLFSGKLTQENTFQLPSGPDNIDVDEKGDLWIAAHPKLFGVVAYMSDPSKPSPSEIYHVAVKDGIPQSADRVYADLGAQIGAASVGATARGHLFIGSIFDPKILDCALH
jgi:arylesterase/paraoxonase